MPGGRGNGGGGREGGALLLIKCGGGGRLVGNSCLGGGGGGFECGFLMEAGVFGVPGASFFILLETGPSIFV